MLPALLVVVAVVQTGGVATVELPTGRELSRLPLASRSFGVFVAPDGALWLPSAEREETLVVRLGQPVETIPGRLVPLFFREPDRLYAVFPGELVVLAYPERVRIASWPLSRELSPTFATCSHDGRVVAVLTTTPHTQVVLVFPFDQGQTATVPLSGFPSPRLLALSDGFLAVGGDGRVGIWPLGSSEGVQVEVPGNVVSMAWSPDGRELFLLLAARRSEVWRVPVPKKASRIPKPKRVWQGEGEPQALGLSEEGLLVLEDHAVRLLSPKGRELGQVTVTGGYALGVIPSRPISATVPWSDSQP
ncbi:MAG: hypothetical protein ACK42L_03340 [Thermoanaerobaculum sp.]